MNTLGVKQGIKTLSPAYFALVMSTGIIALASDMLGYKMIGSLFFMVNNIEFAVLIVLYVIRFVFYFKDFKKDLSSHTEGAGFLTLIAGSCILGTEYVQLKGNISAAALLWQLAIALWILLVYSFFILTTIKKNKPTLEDGINGSWLLLVVSVQALSILGTVLLPYRDSEQTVMIFINLFFYLLGVLFYLIVIGIIFYRTTFFPMKADEFKPSYWIDMGAAAITTLAGCFLVKSLENISMFADIIPTLKVFTLLFWVAGTWWIPVILFLELWRHRSIPIRYSAGYWCLVFPLGVYTACTHQVSGMLGINFLMGLPVVTICIAWIMWVVVFTGMVARLIKTLFQKHFQ